MKKKDAGFSLVELVIVIAVMAILIGVLAPQYIKYVEKSKVSKDEYMADSLCRTAEILVTDEEYYPTVKDGDYIRFSTTGITTNNEDIRDGALDEYISGWQSARVQSKTYQNMYYEIKFVAYMDRYRLVVREGWKTNG